MLDALYLRVLGGRTLWTNADSVGVQASELVLIAQRVSDYVPPTWPGTSVVHLGLAAGLERGASVTFAVASRRIELHINRIRDGAYSWIRWVIRSP